MRIHTRPLVLTAIAAFAGACTTETTCMTPAGNYRVEMKATSGNCPDEFVKALVEGASKTVTKASEQCKTETVSSSNAFEVPDMGVTCSTATSASKASTNAGYSGTASVAVTCSDNSTCQHAFSVSYTKQ